MSKSLSNGTLSLRFMQNALRRQNAQEVELKRAEIKDEGKWEVGRDIRDAWGTGGGKQSSDSVAHESSYLPFLFSSEREGATSRTSKPRGRRMFNKHGLDVSQDESQFQPEQVNLLRLFHDNVDDDDDASGDEDEAVATQMNDDLRTKRHKVWIHANPTPADEGSLANNSLQGFDTSKTGRSSKSARDAIFSLGGVGTDLRSGKKSLVDDPSSEQKPKQQEQGVPSSAGFLKPMGVDEPVTRNLALTSSSKTKVPKSSVPQVIDGARKKKRTRDPNEQETDEKKKRRIKRSVLSRPLDEE